MEIHRIAETIQTLQVMFSMVSDLTGTDQYFSSKPNVCDGDTYDFIIVGAGSAGGTIANRLSEVKECKTLLIDAGGTPPIASDYPGGFPLVDSSYADWNYTATFTYENVTRPIHLTRGKMLGGSSGANYMFYVRGNPEDYNSWEKEGNKGWGWKDVLPSFKKSEQCHDEKLLQDSNLHGASGYLAVTLPNFRSETDELLEPFKEMGHEVIYDVNGHQQLGYSTPQLKIYNGLRQSVANAYLRPIKDRDTLDIMQDAMVTKIIIDGKKAKGVEIKLKNGTMINVMAKKEVIISAGSINTPQLLMLSGIGPKEHLEEMDIPVLLDSPNVGKNLQDHQLIMLAVTGNDMEEPTSGYKIGDIVDAFKFPGPMLMGHVALNKSKSSPDYQSYVFDIKKGSLFPAVFCYHDFKLGDQVCETIAQVRHTAKWVQINVLASLHPKSTGEIKLQSKNPEDHPLIDLGYFSHPDDLPDFVSYIKDFTSVLNSTYYKNKNAKILNLNVPGCEDLEFLSDDYWRCFVKNQAVTQYHPSGTAKMGVEGKGVVDERLRVYGCQGLRVVDASVLPDSISGNINAPVIMVAEKASDMIKMDNGLTV